MRAEVDLPEDMAAPAPGFYSSVRAILLRLPQATMVPAAAAGGGRRRYGRESGRCR